MKILYDHICCVLIQLLKCLSHTKLNRLLFTFICKFKNNEKIIPSTDIIYLSHHSQPKTDLRFLLCPLFSFPCGKPAIEEGRAF